MPQGTMGANLIVINPPSLNEPARVVQAEKPLLIQAFIAQCAIKAFDIPLLVGYPGRVQSNLLVRWYGRPSIQGLADACRPSINEKFLCLAHAGCHALEHLDHACAR